MFARYKKNGFTLIEFSVVALIMGILVSATLVGYRNGQKRYILSGATQEFIAEIRNVQNMAMQGTEIKDVCEEDILALRCYGYGIYIDIGEDDTSYLIFAERNSDNDNEYIEGDSDDILIGAVSLPTNVKLEYSLGKVSIYFKSPWPTGYIDGEQNTTNAVITLKYEGTSLTKTVSVSSAGLIE